MVSVFLILSGKKESSYTLSILSHLTAILLSSTVPLQSFSWDCFFFLNYWTGLLTCEQKTKKKRQEWKQPQGIDFSVDGILTIFQFQSTENARTTNLSKVNKHSCFCMSAWINFGRILKGNCRRYIQANQFEIHLCKY